MTSAMFGRCRARPVNVYCSPATVTIDCCSPGEPASTVAQATPTESVTCRPLTWHVAPDTIPLKSYETPETGTPYRSRTWSSRCVVPPVDRIQSMPLIGWMLNGVLLPTRYIYG